MTDTCKTCKFFKWFSDEYDYELGMCRRYPPVFVGLPTSGAKVDDWDRPTVESDRWCGEFASANALAKSEENAG